MKIAEEHIGGARCEVALDLLRSGIAIDFNGLSVRLSEPSEVEVIVWSAWGLGKAPEDAYREELIVGANKFAAFVEAWEGLQALVAGRRYTVLLGYDYGNGSVVLGRLSDDGEFVRA